MNSFLYLFYLFATLVLDSFNIGPYSVRVYMNVIMAIYLVSTRRKSGLNLNNEAKSFTIGYLAFIIVTTLTILITGEYQLFDYSKYFLALLFPAVVLIFATRRYVTNKLAIRNVIVFLLSIGALSGIATILQSRGSAFGMILGNLFNNTDAAQTSFANMAESYDSIGTKTGYGFAGGIFCYAFANGLFLSTVGFYSFYFLLKNTKLVFRLLLWFLILISIYACLLTQERVCFVTMLIAVGYMVFYYSNSKKGIRVLISLILLGGMYLGWSFIESYDWGRVFLLSMEDDSRTEIWACCMEFLSEHFLFGGPATYNILYPDMPPHNFFFNSFILSGLLGGIIISCLFIWIMLIAIKNVIQRKQEEMSTVMFSLSVLISCAYSLFHSAGLQNGTSIIILVVTLMLCKASLKDSVAP